MVNNNCMNEKEYNVKTIAIEHLSYAIKLYLNDEYLPAITLAGAAEEILGKFVKKENKKNALSSIIEFAKLYASAMNKKVENDNQIINRSNKVRNRLKHFDSGDKEEICFIPKLEAFLIISRAIENYHRLPYNKRLNYLPDNSLDELLNKFRLASTDVG